MTHAKWKRTLAAVAVALTLSLGFTSPSSAATVFAAGTTASASSQQVTANRALNVRSGAGTSYSKVGEIQQGSSYAYLGSKKASNGSTWYKIQYSASKTGWVFASYTTLSAVQSQTTDTTVSAARQVVEITADKVNLRSGASTSYSKVGESKKGNTYTYLAQKKASNGKVWYQIQYSSSQKAWVISSYAKVKTVAASTTATTASTTATTASATASTTAATTTAVGRQVVEITGSKVNVRSGAGTSYSKVGESTKGSTYTYLAQKKAADGKVWYQFQYSSAKKAWVISSYAKLKTVGGAPSTQPTEAVGQTERRVQITGSKVNLRSGAGTTYSKVGEASSGSSYKYLAQKKASNGKLWYQLQYSSSQKAWVIASYAKLVTVTVTPSATPTTSATAASSTDTTTTAPTQAPSDNFTPYMKRVITIKKGTKAVYAEANAKSQRAGTVYGGAKYTVTGWQDDGTGTTWYSFKLNGKTVWISRLNTTVKDTYTPIPVRDFRSGGVPVIYLSPSKQPHNTYACGNTNEQEQMYRVADELRKILESEYVCTVYTASTDLYLTLNGRSRDAYNRRADVYLAIHSNSDGSKTRVNYGAVGYYHPAYAQSKQLAQNIISEMGKIAPHRSTFSPSIVDAMGSFDGTGYSDVRDPSYYGMVSVLAEVEYHDNVDSSRWIVQNPQKIARALANALETTFHLQKK